MIYGINDGKMAYYTGLGFTGTVDDMERQYLDALTGFSYPGASLQDLWLALGSLLGIDPGSVNGVIKRILEYTMVDKLPTYNDAWVAFVNFELNYTPRTLLDGATNGGAWYDISAVGTLYQDSDGTIPVTAVGDPVGFVTDRSSNGNHLIQTTNSKRPVLRQDTSGYYYLEFDGATQCLVTANTIDMTGASGNTFCSGFKRDSTTTADTFIEHGIGGADVYASTITSFAASPKWYSTIRGPTGAPSSDITISANKSVVTVLGDRTQATSAAQIVQRLNGASVSNTVTGTAVPTNSKFGNYKLYVGARNQTTNPFVGRLYQLVWVSDIVTGGDLTDLEGWVNSKTGAY